MYESVRNEREVRKKVFKEILSVKSIERILTSYQQRFDGLEVMIQYGTGKKIQRYTPIANNLGNILWCEGSHSGHSTIAMWLDGALHVCESTGETDYWPPPYGHICTPWDQVCYVGGRQQCAVNLIDVLLQC